MRRREFSLALGGAIGWPLVVRAQQPMTAVPRVGWLVTGSPVSYRFSLAAFRDGLKRLGYTEGQNISIVYRWAEGSINRLPELAEQLVQQQVDVIVAGGSVGAQAAKRATSIIPIIAAGAGDLVELGLVENLAKPAGNLTGFVAAAPETAAKRMQIMKELLLQSRHAAVLWNSDNFGAQLELAVTKDFAAANHIVINLYGASDVEQLNIALSGIAKSGADMLIVLSDPLIFTYRKVVVDAADRIGIPAMYSLREYVDDGGLVSYGPDIRDTYRRAAGYAAADDAGDQISRRWIVRG
jgi:putative tryptophan/tyrosine transport system substrate-binding protein